MRMPRRSFWMRPRERGFRIGVNWTRTWRAMRIDSSFCARRSIFRMATASSSRSGLRWILVEHLQVQLIWPPVLVLCRATGLRSVDHRALAIARHGFSLVFIKDLRSLESEEVSLLVRRSLQPTQPAVVCLDWNVGVENALLSYRVKPRAGSSWRRDIDGRHSLGETDSRSSRFTILAQVDL